MRGISADLHLRIFRINMIQKDAIIHTDDATYAKNAASSADLASLLAHLSGLEDRSRRSLKMSNQIAHREEHSGPISRQMKAS